MGECNNFIILASAAAQRDSGGSFAVLAQAVAVHVATDAEADVAIGVSRTSRFPFLGSSFERVANIRLQRWEEKTEKKDKDTGKKDVRESLHQNPSRQILLVYLPTYQGKPDSSGILNISIKQHMTLYE